MHSIRYFLANAATVGMTVRAGYAAAHVAAGGRAGVLGGLVEAGAEALAVLSIALGEQFHHPVLDFGGGGTQRVGQVVDEVGFFALIVLAASAGPDLLESTSPWRSIFWRMRRALYCGSWSLPALGLSVRPLSDEGL